MTGFFAARISENVSWSAASSVCGSDFSGAASGDSGYRNFAIDHVVRHFDVNRTLVAQTRLDATNNFGSSALFIEQHRACDGDLVVNAALRLERFHLVMKERIFLAIFAPGSAAHHHHRRFFRICAGNRIQNIESADAIGHANQTDPVDARISISGKTRAGSCVIVMLWIFDFSSQANVGKAKSPGIPKLWRTPRR